MRTKLLGTLAFTSLCVAAVGCSMSTSGRGAEAAGPGAPANPATAGQSEVFHPRSVRQRSQALLRLPGAKDPAFVAFDVVDGMAVIEGDMLLGPANQVQARYGPSLFGGQSGAGGFHAVTINDTSHLWPGGSIPFEIDSSVPPVTVQAIQGAIAEMATTPVRLRPRTPADRDYVVFRDNGDGCSSFVGRIGGAQTISVSGCGRGSVLHEILHSAGFYHEQSRNDRDDFITIVWSAIEPSQQSNFQTHPSVSQDLGAYDYGSIMHYGTRAFSRTGQPTIIPKAPGVTIGQRDGLSQLDRAALATLYGGVPGVPTQPTTIPPNPTQPSPTQPGPVAGGSFAGRYTSNQGDVVCTELGSSQLGCQLSGGSLTCNANGDTLACVWLKLPSQGRATFRRQPTGVLAGSWGDALSDSSRGAWDLVPVAGSQPPPTAPGSAAPPWWPLPTDGTLPALPGLPALPTTLPFPLPTP